MPRLEGLDVSLLEANHSRTVHTVGFNAWATSNSASASELASSEQAQSFERPTKVSNAAWVSIQTASSLKTEAHGQAFLYSSRLVF